MPLSRVLPIGGRRLFGKLDLLLPQLGVLGQGLPHAAGGPGLAQVRYLITPSGLSSPSDNSSFFPRGPSLNVLSMES